MRRHFSGTGLALRPLVSTASAAYVPRDPRGGVLHPFVKETCQYVLSPPPELVGLLGARPEPLSALTRIFVRCMFDGIVCRVDAGASAHPGAVVVVQKFSKTIGLFPHAHVLALDGAYVEVGDHELEFRVDPGPAGRVAIQGT